MNYKRMYINLIRFRQNNPLPNDIYSEKHHIIPTSLGGKNIQDNLVKLSFKEHKLAHHLLERIFNKRLQIFQSKKAAKQHFKMKMAYLIFFKNKKTKSNILNKTQGKYHTKQKVKLMFAFFIRHDCGNNHEAYCQLQEKFNYFYKKDTLYQLFSRYNLKINDVLFKNKQNRYNKQQVETMYQFFITNNKNYEKTKEYFNYSASNQSLTALFKRFGLQKIQHRNGSYEKVKQMFLYYKENDCGNNSDKYQEFKDKFNYSGTNRALLTRFRRYGFYLDKYQYSQEQLQEMFDYFVENQLYKPSNSIDEFREKFNYPYKKKSLRVLFKQHNLIPPAV